MFFKRMNDLARRVSDIEKKIDRISEIATRIDDSCKVSDIEKKIDRLFEIVTRVDGSRGFSMAACFASANIFSYLQNEFIQKNSPDGKIFGTTLYKYIKKVSELTKCFDVISPDVEKIRVGNTKDGGYVMIKPFSKTKIAYSFGINNDVSWDLDVANAGYQVYQYDHTIKGLPKEHPSFHWEKTGLTGNSETDDKKNLTTLLMKNGHADKSGMLLKMDIEKDEWAVFANMDLKLLEKFDQITIEMHDLEMCNRELIIKALENLSTTHIAIHKHANNYGRLTYCGNLILPETIEITYIKKGSFEVKANENILPEDGLDIANFTFIEDYWLGNTKYMGEFNSSH